MDKKQLIPGVSRFSRSQAHARRAIRGTEATPKTKVAGPRKKKTTNQVKLRSSITPGTILILVSGKFQGKRVVFLKQLSSGLLLVSGPMKLNGVPIRRVNQAFVIATETKIDVSKVDVNSIDDDFFKVDAPKKKKELLAEPEAKVEVSAERVAAQKKTDLALLAIVKKTPGLKGYLSTPFTLTNGQYPHALKF
jgi:large subunit ribosomal protein L6e